MERKYGTQDNFWEGFEKLLSEYIALHKMKRIEVGPDYLMKLADKKKELRDWVDDR